MKRTELRRRAPLLAVTPLVRRVPLRTRTALSAAGARTLANGYGQLLPGSGLKPFPPAACALIDARDADHDPAIPVRMCQRCGSAGALHRHHRRGKDSGGSEGRPHTQCPCNGITLCLYCHIWAHSHPGRARAEGWIVSQAEDEPWAVSVMRFAEGPGGASQFPTCGGQWITEAAA